MGRLWCGCGAGVGCCGEGFLILLGYGGSCAGFTHCSGICSDFPAYRVLVSGFHLSLLESNMYIFADVLTVALHMRHIDPSATLTKA